MLTRALTWSRNWSQGFAASLSRSTWVAVVIVKDKTKPLGYFHRCVKAVESSFSLTLLQASGFLSAFGYRMPLGSVGESLGFASLPTAALRPRGIVSD